MKDFDDFIKKIVKFRDERNWKQFHNPKDLALSLVLEAAEVMEHFQWKDKKEMNKYIQENKEEIGDELSDVLYWVLLLSNDLDINISEAFERKLKKNQKKYPVEKAKNSHQKYDKL